MVEIKMVSPRGELKAGQTIEVSEDRAARWIGKGIAEKVLSKEEKAAEKKEAAAAEKAAKAAEKAAKKESGKK